MVNKEFKIKGILVGFFREGRDGDYLQALEQATKELTLLIAPAEQVKNSDGLTATDIEALDVAKEEWKTGKKLSAISTVRHIFHLDLFGGKNYCEKHFQ